RSRGNEGSTVRDVRLRITVACANRRDLLAILQKEIADGKALVEDAARIAAEVEHDAADVLLLERSHRVLHFLGCRLVESVERDVADFLAIRAEGDLVPNRGYVDHCAREMHFDGRG